MERRGARYHGHRGQLAEQAAADALGLEPWEPGDKSHYIRLSLQVLTGRRFKVAAPHIWSTRLMDQRRASCSRLRSGGTYGSSVGSGP